MRAETKEGRERQRNKETRLEDAPSPALQQTATTLTRAQSGCCSPAALPQAQPPQSRQCSLEAYMGPIATEEENGVSELKWQHVRQWNEVAKLGKRWQLDTRKAQECLLIQLHSCVFLAGAKEKRCAGKWCKNTTEGQKARRNKETRIEDAPSPAL